MRTSSSYFKRINVIIKKFLTPRVLKMQHRQMNKSLLYRPSKIEDWENLLESEQKQADDEEQSDEERSNDEEQSDEERSDNEEQSDEERSDNEEQSDEEHSDNEEQSDKEPNNKHEEHRQSDNDDEKINFAEDDYESSISNLNSLVRYLNNANIREVWSVKTIEQNKEHFVVISDNANHLCTCMLLVSKGLDFFQ